MTSSYFTDLLLQDDEAIVPDEDENIQFNTQYSGQYRETEPSCSSLNTIPTKRSWTSFVNNNNNNTDTYSDQAIYTSATHSSSSSSSLDPNNVHSSSIVDDIIDPLSPPLVPVTDFATCPPQMDSASSFSSPSMDFAYLDSLDFQQQYQPSFPSSQGSHRTIYQSRDSVMASIENTILEIFESLSKTKPVELQVLSRTLNRRQVNASSLPSSDLPTGSDGPLYTGEPRMKSLSLNTTASATSLTRYVRVLEIVYEALANNIMVTKRDIFYRDVPLFKTQPIVDKIVDDICCHYNVPRSCLNVSASGKGRIFGPANIILKNHRVLNCMSSPNGNSDDCNDEQGTLIPPISQILDVECRAQLLVVIEKEASFRHLVSVGFVQRLLHRCVLITGCGYPDFATRHMVKHLSTRYPRMPVLAVMDNDPYGLDIYSVYKWGSMAQAHDSVNLTIPSMKFLGLEYADRKKYQIPDIAYTPLTMKDREKGIRMIQSAQQLQSNATTEYKQFILEVCKILHRNQKCELQALCSDGPLGFIEYLQLKLEAQLDTIFVY